MKPFLLLSTRPEDEATEGEREAVVRLGRLADDDLVQVRVEAAPLPPINLDDYTGVFLGGGPFNASDTDKSGLQLRVEADLGRVLDEVIQRDFPLLGLCYGIGAVSSRLGGIVDRTYGEPVSVADVTLTPEGEGDPLFEGVPSRLGAFVGHKEASRELAPGAVLLASGDVCPVQAFRVGDFVYATQFHPELDRVGMASRIRIYKEEGYFDPSETQELVSFAESATITPEVHRILSNFVGLARRRTA
ncbi:GMP synthase (glutamine-hydrolysing) [Tessaracoccus bendigoensis DSM 12906]|uniref:GMP synthase (Glutamine-hydrolysing) n=1 Tax=Tessaracoccus bendigoensis DSM 12906 TaxID=1123357 RepID=A0A1M6M1E5_9ACTN|nr:glutamine amidotransferase [Tessaracoccus bendigoensis]SHJ77311.1 GMP synthase (glutamine-hydrolysing) [Tessaracoccus bendigoensis DSM 12906]